MQTERKPIPLSKPRSSSPERILNCRIRRCQTPDVSDLTWIAYVWDIGLEPRTSWSHHVTHQFSAGGVLILLATIDDRIYTKSALQSLL